MASFFDSKDSGDYAEKGSGSFTCRIDNVRDITDVLICLSLNTKKDLLCLFEATPQSLMFVVTGRSKNTQARLSLPADLFDDYMCSTASSVQLSLNLTTLLDCMQLFGSSDTAAATMTYSTEDATFRLSLEDSGILTTCELSGMYHEEDEDDDQLQGGLFSVFRDRPEESAVVLRSEALREHILELCDVPGAASVKVRFDSKAMWMATSGADESTCELNIPCGADIFVSYVVAEQTATWTYPLSSLQLATKALGVAKETFIRVNSEGLMCVQHQVEGKSGKEVFVDFLLVSMESGLEA